MNSKKFSLILLLEILGSNISPVNANDDNLIYSDMAVTENAIWVTSSSGLQCIDKASGESTFYTNENLQRLTAICITPSNEIYVGGLYQEGLGKLVNNELVNVPTPGISFQNIQGMFFLDGLWVGAEFNLSHQTTEGWKVYRTPNEYDSHYAYSFMSYDPNNDRIWFGADTSGVFNKTGYIDDDLNIHYIEEMFFNSITGLTVADNSTVYVSTNYGIYTVTEEGYILFEATGDEDTAYGSILASGDDLWYTYGNTLCRFNGIETEEFPLPEAETTEESGKIIKIIGDGNSIRVLNSRRGVYSWIDGNFQFTSGLPSSKQNFSSTNPQYFTIDGRKVPTPPSNEPFIINGRVMLNNP